MRNNERDTFLIVKIGTYITLSILAIITILNIVLILKSI